MEKRLEFEKTAELVFKVIYLLFVLFSFNVLFARHWYMVYVAYVVVVMGVLIGVFRFLHVKDYLNAGVFLLFSFICSYVLGAVNTFQYGYIDNMKAVVWMSVQFFLLFAFDKNRDCSKERFVLSSAFLFYTLIASIVSLWMMSVGWQHYDIYENMYFLFGGFIDNRLWGCYIDPNYGAVLSLVSVLISFGYLFSRRKMSVIWKIILVINIILEFLYICYSDSRTGMLAIFASVITLTVVWFSKKKGLIKSLLLGIVIVIITIGLLYGVKWATSMLKIEQIETNASSANLSEEEIAARVELARIGRVEEQIGNGQDFTNNRFKIWVNSIEMFKQHPVFGISFRNIREYAYDNIPDTYAEYESMHNFFFDVLVSQGIVGILILLSFMVWVIWTLVKKYLSIKAYREFAFMMAVVAAIFASMLTYSESFYMNTGGAFMFWYVLGFLVNYREKDETMVEV